MKRIIYLFFIVIFFTISQRIFAQGVDLSGVILTSDIVSKSIFTDGMKGTFCQVNIGATAQELLTAPLETIQVSDVQSAPCVGPDEEILFAHVLTELKQQISGVSQINSSYIVFNNQLLQENNYSLNITNYPNAPDNFSFSYFNGGEEGNSEFVSDSTHSATFDPVGIEFVRLGNLILIDDTSQQKFRPIGNSGYIIGFDEQGKRKVFLFIFKGKIFKLLHSERKLAESVLVDNSLTPFVTPAQSYLNTYVDPTLYYVIQYPPYYSTINTTPENGIAFFPIKEKPIEPYIFSLTASQVPTGITDPLDYFGKHGQIKYTPDASLSAAIRPITVGKDTGYLLENIPLGDFVLNKDQVIIHGDTLINIQTSTNGKSPTDAHLIFSSFHFADE